MLRALPFRMPFRLLTAVAVAACGGDAPKDDSAADPTSAPLSVGDIERWEKGMAAELAAVRGSGAKLASARTGEDTLSALMGVQEMTTTAVGAEAAGVDQERYQTVRSNLAAAVAYLTPHLGGIDTTMLSVAQREEMRQMNAAQLKQLEGAVPPEVVEALKPKAEALRKKELELAGARLKGAGI
jgi:hypothetical protein